MLYLKQSTASQAVLIGPFIDDTDGKTAETGLTIANTDIRLSANGGNMFSKTSGGGTHDEAGWYTITLDATDTATVGRLQISTDVSGALPTWAEFQVVEELVYVNMFAASAVGPLTAAAVNAEIDTALTDIHLDHLLAVDAADVVVDDSAIAQLAATAGDWSDFAKATDSLQSIRDHATTIKTDTSTTIDLVNGLGGSTGGSVSIETVLDNTVIDTTDAAAAVDKGTSPETVGVPVTGHAFVAGQQVTLAGTTNYNGSFDVDSVTTNEVVILATFAAETFGGADTIISTVKTIPFVGSVQTGSVTSTEALDGVIHDIDDVGNDIDLVYTFSVGAGRTATEIVFHGFVQGNGDTIDIEVYDHVGTAWEILRTITGQNGTSNITLEVPLLLKHTGTSGLDTGRVYVRFDTNATTPSNLSIDQLLVEAINTGALSAYENGQIWINTNASNTNTVADVDGTSRRPVSTIEALKTLSTSTGLSDFHVINGSILTLVESTANESYFGNNWTLALGGQAMAGAHFEGAIVSGVQTGTNVNFRSGHIGTATLAADAHLDEVGLQAGTITLTAGSYTFERCFHDAVSLPIIDFAAGNSTLHMHAYHGGFEVQNMDSSDTIHLDGDGRLDINANCSGGVINVRGAWDINDSGSSTITYDDTTAEVTAILLDTVEIGTAGAGLTNINLPNQTMDIVGSITGSLSGSVGSVTGAVGSVTGAVGSVAGNVDGSVGSVTGDINTSGGTIKTLDALDTAQDTQHSATQGATFSGATDSLEAIRDRGDAAWTTGAGGSDRLLMVDTTIATLATQISFTLTAGSVDNGAYNNCTIIIEDVSTATQKAVGMVLAYAGGTKTITLKEALAFTIATTDKVYILAENSLKSTVANRQLDVTANGAAGIDWANVENPTTALDLSGTDIQLVDTTTVNTDMRGTDGANTTTPLTAAEVNAEVDTALVDYDGPTNAEMEARTILSASYFDPAVDAVATVTLVVTTTTNTDMRGTDSAALASVATEVRLAELDAANLPSDVDAILLDTGTTLDAAIAVIDLNVDQIEATVITNAAGVDIAADIIALKTETALIVADTNELQTDNVPGLIAALNNIAASDILTTTLTESYAANGVAPTLSQFLFAIQQMLMQFGISGTALTVRKLDDTTTAFVVTLDDATNPTDAKRV